jgi:hypothetical protein
MEETMSEKCELDVLGVSYAGPHSVQSDIYTIEVQVQPTPGAPWGHIALRFRPAEATFLAHVMQSNPPHARVDEHLMEQVAAHDT